jgi:FAD:protein FMN transferase
MTANTNKLSRRQFIRMTAVAGLAAVGSAGLVAGLKTWQQPARVQETRLLLGSIAHLTVISDDAAQARAAISAAFDRMELLENVFSRFRPQSQLSQLNAVGMVSNPHPALREVLEKAIY